MSIALETALDAAQELLWGTFYVPDCLDAIARKKWAIYLDPSDDEKTDCCDYLGEIADIALTCADLCRAEGLTELAEYLSKIDQRLRAVAARGAKDVDAARADLAKLTEHARAAHVAASPAV